MNRPGTGILMIGEQERAAIQAALGKMRERPIPLEIIQKGAIDGKRVVKLADRKPGPARPQSAHLMLGSYRASVSFEQQLSGLACHLSVSSAEPGKVPGPEVMFMVAVEFGCPLNGGKLDAYSWLEEFDPGHFAVNLLWLVKP